MPQSVDQRFARVRELFEQERREAKIARTLDDIPISFELISHEWLSRVLCAGVHGAEVTAHTLDIDREGTTNRGRIFLQYNAAGQAAKLPPSVFCKATQTLESRFILGLNNCAEGEITFYNKVRALLDIEAPVAYFSKIDRESLNSITLLRDMTGQVEFCDERTQVSQTMARDQLGVLARLHGKFYGKSGRETPLSDYQTIEEFNRLTEEGVHWSERGYEGLLQAEPVVPARLLARAKDIWPATSRAFARHGDLPRTLIHNDVHLKNWYITSAGRMGLSDWQCVVRGHWCRDLAYVISSSLSPDNRRAWERELIAYYLECLAGQGIPTPSLDQTMRLYRQQLFAALQMWTVTLARPEGAPEMQPPATSLEFIRRIATAIDDHNAFASFD
ncbi:MAG: phosphotransferase [Steroidobacteraceae bacterium]